MARLVWTTKFGVNESGMVEFSVGLAPVENFMQLNKRSDDWMDILLNPG